ncbi:unnamed protein product [Blepharisma stoltei]|uniref:Uncharacterized protein n=1 Tax=Blepharisma stoltei TaxID=1481888 RepID=A0AAU9IDL1_9CILI|nr:unnamed protein product [Blepharisma stoltei]
MRSSYWLLFIGLSIHFLSNFSRGYSVYDETIPTLRDCPALDANKHIEIMRASIYYKSRQKTDIFMKLVFDSNYIYTLLTPYIIPEEIKKLKNSPDEIRVFYPSAIWLEERNVFLAVVQVNLWDTYSFLYSTFFDSEWNEIRDEDYIGNTKVPGIMEIEKIWLLYLSGPEDPRIFRGPKGELYFIFNKLTKDFKRTINIYSYSTGTSRQLVLEEHLCSQHILEKDWTPLIVDDEHMYFIYNYKNLQIIDCTEENETCKKVKGIYDPVLNSIRGGSPYARYADTNYFISFIYTNVSQDAPEIKMKPYRPALSIIEYIEGVRPDFKLIYASEPIDFGNRVFLSPVSQYKSIKQTFDSAMSRILMVHSISRWNYKEDIVDLTLTVNESFAIAIRVKGITDLVQFIINMYEYGRIEEKEDCAILLAFNYHRQLWPRHLFNTIKFS